MRSLLIMAAVLSGVTALAGCHNKKPEPVPGPQSTRLQHEAAVDSDCPEARAAHRRSSEIGWLHL